MSMMPPPFRADPSDEGIPAADPGAGAPPPAPGFGIDEGEPDVAPDEDAEEADGADRPDGTAFRTPDPGEVGPDSQG